MTKYLLYALLLCLAAINIVAFFLYGIDKWKARHDKWRATEARLIAVALLGGSVGAFLGMKPLFFRPITYPVFAVREQRTTTIRHFRIVPIRRAPARLFWHSFVQRSFVTMSFPGSPNKPEQTYRLTEKGLDLYKKVMGE